MQNILFSCCCVTIYITALVLYLLSTGIFRQKQIVMGSGASWNVVLTHQHLPTSYAEIFNLTGAFKTIWRPPFGKVWSQCSPPSAKIQGGGEEVKNCHQRNSCVVMNGTTETALRIQTAKYLFQSCTATHELTDSIASYVTFCEENVCMTKM